MYPYQNTLFKRSSPCKSDENLVPGLNFNGKFLLEFPQSTNKGHHLRNVLQYLQTEFNATIRIVKASWMKKDTELTPPFVKEQRDYFVDSLTREWNWLFETWEKANQIDIDTISLIRAKLEEIKQIHQCTNLENLKKNPKIWENEVDFIRKHVRFDCDQFGSVLVPKTCKIQLPCGHDDYFARVEIGINGEKEPVVVKHIKPTVMSEVRQIAASGQSVHHKHVLSYYLTAGPDSVLVMPLMCLNLGQYVMYLRMANRLENKAYQIVYQIMNGLVFLHKTNHPPIIHGNLKPTNIFIDESSQIRLADFGLNYKSKPSETSLIWKSVEQVRRHKNGQPCRISLSGDVASAGMLTYFVMTSGRHPFGVTVPEILDNLVAGRFECNITDAVSSDLLSHMLTSDEKTRPDISEVTRHIFWWSTSKRWGLVEKLKTAVKENAILMTFLATAAKNFVLENDQAILEYKGGAKSTQQDLLDFSEMLKKSAEIYEMQLRIPNIPLHLYNILKPTPWAHNPSFKPFFDARYF